MLMQNDLAAENARLRERIEELEFRIKDLCATSADKEMITDIGKRLGVRHQTARLAFYLRDGVARSLEQCLFALETEMNDAKNISVHVCHLRRGGIKIKTIWGHGYRMEPEGVEKIKALIGGAVVTTA